MGWWKSNGPLTGGLDIEGIGPEGETNGDGPADIMGTAIDEIYIEFVNGLGRPPTPSELVGCFAFCFHGHIDRRSEGAFDPEEKPELDIEGLSLLDILNSERERLARLSEESDDDDDDE